MIRRAGGLVVVLLAASLLSACGGRKAGSGLEGARAGELGEEALPAARGSLAQARAGTLGAEGAESGPLTDIHFAFDSFDLDGESRQVLQQNASWLNDHPAVRVEIEGHCDDRGTVEYNLALGARRAATTKGYLVTLGVAGGRITTISYGEELPLCHEATESCYRRNRRAHFAVIGNG
jgi:peptidoglycan-associated lipoprotein